VATPVPCESRHAFEQHDPEMPSPPQGSPTTEQEPVSTQWPTITPPGRSQYRVQHCESFEQSSPPGRQLVPSAHRQPVSAASVAHAPPIGLWQ